jgi:hypothetical protein
MFPLLLTFFLITGLVLFLPFSTTEMWFGTAIVLALVLGYPTINLWMDWFKYRGATRRYFLMRAYGEVPKDEQIDRFTDDLLAEPWGLELISRKTVSRGKGFMSEFLRANGEWLMVLGEEGEFGLSTAFIVSPNLAGRKDEFERFARDKGWKE